MAISHADHNHPNTPAARAACRKALNGRPDANATVTAAVENHRANKTAAKLTVVPRRRGDGGVVKGLKAADPRGEVRILTAGDLPSDIPSAHVLTIARAWEKGWTVILGERLKEDQTRILIGGDMVQVSLVWNAEGRSGVFVRAASSSITHRVDSGPQAIALACGEEEWPWVAAGKAV